MIRKLQKSDKKQLLKLFWEFNRYNKENLVPRNLQPFHKYKNPKKTFSRGVNDYISKKKFIVFVADINGKLVGYCAARLIGKPDRVLNKQATIEDWFVQEPYRKLGLGRALFRALIREAKKQRCTHARLDVLTTNKKAQRIYHKYGFIDNTIEMCRKL